MSTSLAKPYSPLTKTLHWVVAALIYTNLTIGFYMRSVNVGIERLQLVTLHKSVGFMIYLFVIVRVILALCRRYQQRHQTLPIQRRLILLSHRLLYLLLITLPLSGIIMSMSLGYYLPFFHFFSVPPLIAESKTVFQISHTLHFTCVYLLLTMLVIHVSVALYHHCILKNRYLSKMLFQFRQNKLR